MHMERRLWSFTKGVRLRILAAVAIGLASVGTGIARLALLGWLIGAVFAGADMTALILPIALVAAAMLLRGVLEYARAMVAHETAARVQRVLRRTIYDHIVTLGPGTIGQERSGALTLSMIDGVEQLETYFGRFLPQFLIALLSPILIFVVIAWFDVPVALVMVGFALVAMLAPALWHRVDSRNGLELRHTYSRFAAEFLDAIQGMATLKAFGRSKDRAERLERDAHAVFERTMKVLGTNILAIGITDSSVACGAAAALALGAWRVESGAMALSSLLVILMLGTEIFRPMRELRNVLHQGMVGMSAAQGVYRILDRRPLVEAPPAAVLDRPIAPEIVFDAVGFHYPGSRRTIHDGLSFRLAAGERIGVVGTSGGGKSSIVRLLLRFYDPVHGSIRLGGHDLRSLSFEQIRANISVVNQDTFLFHGTFEDNIRMGRPDASMADIEAAARASNIHEFILSLDRGYQTVVGEKGVRLSGGQRQRVAIARALLRDTPILVLDEALSAVDAENEAVIQQALDRLMRGRTTLILAHRLSSIIGCDRILVLDGGKVVESGPHHALMAQGGVYARLMAEQARDAEATEVIDAVPEDQAIEATASGVIETAPTEGIIKAAGLGWVQLIAVLMRLVMPWKGRLTITFCCGIGRMIAFVGIGILSALVILHLRHGEPYGSLLWALAVLAPLAGVLHWLESWIAHDMAFRLLAKMRVDLFRKIDALAPAYLVRRRTGDLMALATNDVDLVESFFAHTVAPTFVAMLIPVAVLVALALASPWFALTLLPFLLAVGISPFMARGRIDQLGSESREASGELGAFAVDSIQGLGEIVASQQESGRGDRLDALSDRYIRLRLSFFDALTRQESLLELFTGLGGLAVTVTGALLVQQGALDAGLLPLLTILAMAAFLPVSEIAQVGRQLADTLGATRRIYGLHNEPVPVTDGPGLARPLPGASLVLEQVSFAYPGQTKRALTKVSVALPAGRTVALVGTSGAGKTTTAQLLMRFWDPDEGRILLNGIDLRDYKLDDLRAGIALVAQDTYLFNDTLGNNIRLARPEATALELRRAIEQASLAELVESLPDGLDSMVGERGTSLSGGQRQRIAIARAFLKDAPILILDEATSHLDTLNEQAVRRALDRLRSDRTTIVIAHRLSTIRDADLILVLDRGRIVEAGTHDALLATDRLYARLVGRQLSAALASAAE